MKFQNLLFLITISTLIYSRGYSCTEIDSIISNRYNNGDYEIAHNMAKKNKDKESCDALFYFNLGKVFKKFDDFNTTREMYNLAMKKSNETDYKTINLEYKKLSFFSSQINFIQSIYASDNNKEKAKYNGHYTINSSSWGMWRRVDDYARIHQQDAVVQRDGWRRPVAARSSRILL